MNPRPHSLDKIACFCAFCLPLIAVFLAGCVGDTTTPRPGTAASTAVTAEARASSLTSDADKADLQAAASAARANQLTAEAVQIPTEARIAAAVEARVQAATDAAVATQLNLSASKATAAAVKAEQDAAAAEIRSDAAKAAQARKDRAWWIAALATCLGVVGGALLVGLKAPFRWQIIPVAVLAGGWATYAWAQWATVIAAIVGGALVLGLVVVAILVIRQLIIEWRDAVTRMHGMSPLAAEAHNVASQARQLPWVRRVIDWLLGVKASVRADATQAIAKA